MTNFRPLVLISMTILALATPHFADARAGGGRSSMGSRGTHTYNSPSYSNAQPIQRSTTSPSKATQQPTPGSAQSGFNSQPMGNSVFGGIGGGSPFLRGMAGGFLGAGIASMLFGHSTGYAGGGAGGMLGSLFQILLIGGLIYFGIRMFKRSRSTMTNVAPMNNFSGNFASNNNYTDCAQNTSISLNNTSPDTSTFLNVTNEDKN